MKKLSELRKQRVATQVINRYRQALMRTRRKRGYPAKMRTPSLGAYVRRMKEHAPLVPMALRRGCIKIAAPQVMRRSQNKDQVMQFLWCLRKIIKTKAKRLIVDFTTIQDMSPLCAMLLVSEVHRWQLVRKQKLRVIDSESWNPRIKRLLHDIGLFNLIDLVNPVRISIDDQEPEEKFIRIRSESEVHLETAVRDIEQQVAKVAILLDNDPAVYGGIEEAVTNVTQWAYPNSNTDEESALSKRWWFCASYNKNTGRMTVMVHDHGVGIPQTLPTSKWQEAVRKFFSERTAYKWTDAEILEAAMTVPRSASGHEYRAKGLQKMRELLKRFSRGELRILSGHGEYWIDQDGNAKTALHSYPIGGTLIVWEVWEKAE